MKKNLRQLREPDIILDRMTDEDRKDYRMYERIIDKSILLQKMTLKIQENAMKMTEKGITQPTWQPSESDIKVMMQSVAEIEEAKKIEQKKEKEKYIG